MADLTIYGDLGNPWPARLLGWLVRGALLESAGAGYCSRELRIAMDPDGREVRVTVATIGDSGASRALADKFVDANVLGQVLTMLIGQLADGRACFRHEEVDAAGTLIARVELSATAMNPMTLAAEQRRSG